MFRVRSQSPTISKDAINLNAACKLFQDVAKICNHQLNTISSFVSKQFKSLFFLLSTVVRNDNKVQIIPGILFVLFI